jgi:hypothetical protein
MAKPTGADVVIKFGNQKAAEHFLAWLDGQGEQDYWEWMKYREKEEPGPITATQLNYHDVRQGRNLVVIAKCGRLDSDE